MYYLVNENDVVVAISKEYDPAFEDVDGLTHVSESQVCDYRLVDSFGSVVCSSDCFEDVLKDYKILSGSCSIRLVWEDENS